MRLAMRTLAFSCLATCLAISSVGQYSAPASNRQSPPSDREKRFAGKCELIRLAATRWLVSDSWACGFDCVYYFIHKLVGSNAVFGFFVGIGPDAVLQSLVVNSSYSGVYFFTSSAMMLS